MSTLASGVLADRYRIVRSLGHGAMAEVWEADDELLRRKVAIKILHPHLRQKAMIERFRAEGLATARLRHPAIVTVFDTIAQPDLEAIVMELVEGRTLRFVLDQRGTLPIDRAVYIAAASGQSQLRLVDLPVVAGAASGTWHFQEGESYRETRSRYEHEFEQRYVSWLLGKHGGNVSAAARAAKMDRKYLHDLARRHGLRERS